jgi:hypothetical protein
MERWLAIERNHQPTSQHNGVVDRKSRAQQKLNMINETLSTG